MLKRKGRSTDADKTKPPEDAIEEAVLLLNKAQDYISTFDEDLTPSDVEPEVLSCLLNGTEGYKREHMYHEMADMGFKRTRSGIWYRKHPDHDNVLELY